MLGLLLLRFRNLNVLPHPTHCSKALPFDMVATKMLARRESRVHWVLPSLVHLRALQCSLTCPFPLRALGFLLLFFFCLFARSPSPSTSPSLSSRSPPPSSPPFFLPALLFLGAKIGSSFSLAVRFQVNRRSIPAVSFQRLMKGDARKKITHMLPQLPTSPTKETVESWDRNLVWLMKPCC